MARFYLPRGCVRARRALLSGSDFHHLRHVLRMRVGDRVDIFDGRGWEWEATIRKLSSEGADIELGPRRKGRREPQVKITIAQVVPRLPRMDLVVAKCAEIGVRKIIPVVGSASVARWDRGQGKRRQERWQRMSIEATAQSGGSVVAEVTTPKSFRESLAILARLDVRLILGAQATVSLWGALCREGKGKTVGIMVGPESGFAAEEIEEAETQGLRSVSLGRRILRSETAAIVAAALCACRGDNGPSAEGAAE